MRNKFGENRISISMQINVHRHREREGETEYKGWASERERSCNDMESLLNYWDVDDEWVIREVECE